MTDPTCLNLRERFGDRYRIAREESYRAQYGPRARTPDPWLDLIPCRHGHIFPFGGERLAASTDRRGPIARRLASLPCCEVWQDGSDGVTVLFDAGNFGQVAEVMQPKRRRKLSGAHKSALLSASQANRFVSPGSGADCIEQRGDPTPEVDQEADQAGSG